MISAWLMISEITTELSDLSCRIGRKGTSKQQCVIGKSKIEFVSDTPFVDAVV